MQVKNGAPRRRLIFGRIGSGSARAFCKTESLWVLNVALRSLYVVRMAQPVGFRLVCVLVVGLLITA